MISPIPILSEAQSLRNAAEHEEWVVPFAPIAAPPRGWRLVDASCDGARYVSAAGLCAIVSGAVEQDGKRWIHLSVSHAKRPPNWDELRTAKEGFLGDVYAYSVMPPKRFYVNIHPYVLHLWHCVDGPTLPEFSRGGGSI